MVKKYLAPSPKPFCKKLASRCLPAPTNVVSKLGADEAIPLHWNTSGGVNGTKEILKGSKIVSDGAPMTPTRSQTVMLSARLFKHGVTLSVRLAVPSGGIV